MFYHYKLPMLKIDLPWPPTVNHYWGHRAAGGRVYKFVGQKGKDFRAEVIELMEPYKERCMEHFQKGIRLRVVVHIYPPDRRRRDIDNLGKALLDALDHAGAYDDDSQIDDLRFVRDLEDIVKGGKVVVTIQELKATEVKGYC